MIRVLWIEKIRYFFDLFFALAYVAEFELEGLG